MKTMSMETRKVHLIKLDKDEELLSSIIAYVKKENILAGYLTAIGALEKGKLGYFDVKKKEYLHLSFAEVELVSCMGNIAKNKETKEPMAHIHITVSDKNGNCKGGHLVEGIVSVTAEIYLVETKPGVTRIKDELTGLLLLNPKN